MRRLVLTLLALAACAAPDDSTEPMARIYIIFGQSPAVGGAQVSLLTDQSYAAAEPGVQIARWLECPTFGVACDLVASWGDLQGHPPAGNPGSPNRFMGIELSAGRRLMARYGSGNVKLIVHATSGTNLFASWDPDTGSGVQLYQRMVDDVTSLLTSSDQVAGVFWMQGHGDTGSLAHATAYADELRHLIDRVREDFGPNVKFVYDQLTPYYSGQFTPEVRASQAAIAVEQAFNGVRMVASDGYELRDGTHYTSDAYIDAGNDMADGMIEMEGTDIMATTTAAAIRDRMMTVLEAVTPSLLSGNKFRRYRNEGDGNFEKWAESAPAAALRRFQIRQVGTDRYNPGTGSDTVVESRLVTFEIIVAYPKTNRYGGQAALDRDDVTSSDEGQLEQALGMNGYGNFTPPYPDACWVEGAPQARRDGEGCEYVVIEQTMRFWRAMS